MPCPVHDECRSNTQCYSCSGGYLYEDFLTLEIPLLYRPVTTKSPRQHPYAERRTQERKESAKRANQAHKQSASRKQNLAKLRSSQVAERKVAQAVVRSTVQSGARFGDGDLRLGVDGHLGVDVKLQSKATKQFVVRVEELDKAKRQGCVVVVVTAEGRKFLVSELDYLLLHAADLSELGLAAE